MIGQKDITACALHTGSEACVVQNQPLIRVDYSVTPLLNIKIQYHNIMLELLFSPYTHVVISDGITILINLTLMSLLLFGLIFVFLLDI